MKMKVIDRIILAFYGAVSAVALFFLCLCFIAPVSMLNLDAIGWMRPVSWVLIIGLVVWCVRLIRLQFKSDGSAPKNSAAVQSTEEGDVRVSVRAMETLTRRAIAQTGEVLDSKLRVVNNDASVGIEIDIVVDSETHVPALTARLQRGVKGIIEEYAGVAVEKVVVLVTEIRETTPALPAPAEEPVQAVVVEAEKVEVHAEPDEKAAPAEEENAAPAADEAAADDASDAEADEPCGEAEEESAAEPVVTGPVEAEPVIYGEAFEADAEEKAEAEEAAEEETETGEPLVFEAEVADEWAATIGKPAAGTAEEQEETAE